MNKAEQILPQSESERLLGIELRSQQLRHTTTIALTSVGGIVTLGGSIFSDVPDLSRLWLAAVLMVVAALSSYYASIILVNSFGNDKKRSRLIWICESGSQLSLGIGVGTFFGFAINALN